MEEVKHIFANGKLVATVETVGATSTPYYVHADHLGSSNVLTGVNGDLIEVSDYYPYGALRIDDQTEDFVEQRKFIGEEYDPEIELSYLNARYYDGERGQFLRQDPVFWEVGQTQDGKAILANPQLHNSYSYAGNNPIVGKDPNGRELVTILGVIFLAYGLADLGVNYYDYSTVTNEEYSNQFTTGEQLNASVEVLVSFAGLFIGAAGYVTRLEALVIDGVTAGGDVIDIVIKQFKQKREEKSSGTSVNNSANNIVSPVTISPSSPPQSPTSTNYPSQSSPAPSITQINSERPNQSSLVSIKDQLNHIQNRLNEIQRQINSLMQPRR